jgi:hypothetical protein
MPKEVVITLIIGGIVTVIGALTTAIIAIIAAVDKMREVKTAVEKVGNTNVDQNKKLDNITILVDGRYSEVLQELADVKKMLADKTGLSSDLINAEVAQRRADDQSKTVRKATDAKEKENEPKI